MDISKLYHNEINQIVDSCHRCSELGYVTSDGGNLSMRVDSDLMLITPTKTPKRTMHFEDICAINLSGKVIYAREGKAPTGETPFHIRIMKKRPDVRAIVHAHPPVLTGFAIANSELFCQPFLPEPILEVGPILLVPYETPLSEALSLQFDKLIENSNGFLMENHGTVFCSREGIVNAVDLLQMAENMANSVLVSLKLGNCKPLSVDNVKKLDDVMQIRKLKTPGVIGKYDSIFDLYDINK